MRTLALVLALLAPMSAMALTQLERVTRMELREFGFAHVDVTRLSSAQLAAIHSTANTPGERREKRGMIRSILGGPDTLRGLLR